MLNKLRVRTFAKFIKISGEEKWLECLKRNEAQRIIYYSDGDYDHFETEEEIIKFILEGKKSMLSFWLKQIIDIETHPIYCHLRK